MPCFLITIAYTHLHIKDFLCLFCTHVKLKVQNIYTCRLLLKPSSSERLRWLFEDLGFTAMFLTPEENEHVWCLHRPVLPYFLMFSISNIILNNICNKRQRNCHHRQFSLNCLWCGIPQLNVTNKRFQVTSNLARIIKLSS